MKLKASKIATVASGLALLLIAGCGKGSPAQPSGVTGSDGSTFVAAQPVSPTSNAQITYGSQPITITVTNSASTGSSALTYTFEVATDTAFTNIVFSKAGVAPGTGGQTSVQVATLPGSKTYYWRSRPGTSSTTGPNSTTRSFAVGPPVLLSTPAVASPQSGGTVFGTVTLTVTNVTKTGPAGQLTYHFDVADSPTFSNIVFTSQVAEGSNGQTSVNVTGNLSTTITYYWRAQASDQQNGITTPFSATASFKVQSFDLSQASIYSAPPDLAQWAQTASITSVVFTGEAFLVDFDRRDDGANRWIDQSFGDGTIQYTLGMCINQGGHWNCTTDVLFWYGRDLEASGQPYEVANEWYYDARWGPMEGYQPSDGELVGLFVAAGPTRGASFTLPSCPQVCERSNVAIVPWHNSDQATYTFSASTPSSLANSLLHLVKPRR